MTHEQNLKPAKKPLIPILAVILILILALCYGFNAYLNDYYQAMDTATSATESDDFVTVSNPDGDTYFFVPNEIKAGLIFYPGGKVEYKAYAPLMHQLAQNGILCILPHLTGNLAVLDMNAADGYAEQFPEVSHWYVGGHSLGGVAASQYAAKHSDDFDGVILLAAYSTKDLSQSNLQVISIYGSNDGVLNLQKYQDARSNLPADFAEYVIEGGVHAYFGSYGEQDGDGIATISRDEQQKETVDFITYSMGLTNATDTSLQNPQVSGAY